MARAPVFKSKNEQVYEHLRAMILGGQLEPGSRLVIDHLAESLGVSQIPIREALFRLEAGGFVTLEPHIGARVAELHAKEVREVFQVLEAMEVITGTAACARLTVADLAWLERHVKAMEADLAEPEAWSEGNKRLHLFLGERAGMLLALRVLDSALDHWDRLRRHYLHDVFAHRIPLAQREHVTLLAALARRDEAAVERTLRDHNRAALAAYADHLRAEGHLDGREAAP